MTSTKEVMWALFDRMIYKCQETEEKSRTFRDGYKVFEELMARSNVSVYEETDIISYVASVQRIAYITGMVEGIKMLLFICNNDTNKVSEAILKLIDDLVEEDVS